MPNAEDKDIAPGGAETERLIGGGKSTVLSGGLPGPAGLDVAHGRLVEQYRNLIKANAIYYPVAYRFLRRLGRGRQGEVFLGLRQGARGCVTRHALKVFDPGIYPSAETYWTDMGRIASQISQMQSVNSPNIVSRDSYEEVNGIGYLQMEAINGIDLRYFLQGSHLKTVRARSTAAEWERFTDVIFRIDNGTMRIQPGVAIYILRMVLRAMETVHDHGFVHSDIKPENVMIDRLGYVKVIDYGRANRVDEQVSLLMGTPYYMAPEIHRRERIRIQSDLYAVGILAIELLAGRPMLQSTDEETLLAFKLSLPNRLAEYLPNYVTASDRLMTTLQGLIMPDPDQRYGSSREVEVGESGLAEIHRQLVHMDVDAEYGRELEMYLGKLADPVSNQIEK